MWYAHLISGANADQRAEFDADLLSDPAREQAILRALA